MRLLPLVVVLAVDASLWLKVVREVRCLVVQRCQYIAGADALSAVTRIGLLSVLHPSALGTVADGAVLFDRTLTFGARARLDYAWRVVGRLWMR